jgi:hypothetical protein
MPLAVVWMQDKIWLGYPDDQNGMLRTYGLSKWFVVVNAKISFQPD